MVVVVGKRKKKKNQSDADVKRVDRCLLHEHGPQPLWDMLPDTGNHNNVIRAT